jgi:antitoxin VapB
MVESNGGQDRSMPALNIKNEEAYRLVKELADLEGESMTTVVIEAVRDRLERTREKKDRTGLAERLLAISRGSGHLWDEPSLATRHGDLLYDEYGLPV